MRAARAGISRICWFCALVQQDVSARPFHHVRPFRRVAGNHDRTAAVVETIADGGFDQRWFTSKAVTFRPSSSMIVCAWLRASDEPTSNGFATSGAAASDVRPVMGGAVKLSSAHRRG